MQARLRPSIVQIRLTKALSQAAAAAGSDTDVPVAALHSILERGSFNVSAADAARLADTCPGTQPGTVDYLALLGWLDSLPSEALGSETPDRQRDNLTTASPWQVCVAC